MTPRPQEARSAATPAPDHAATLASYLYWVPPDHATEARAALAALLAENERMRAALERASETFGGWGEFLPAGIHGHLRSLRNELRAALEDA